MVLNTQVMAIAVLCGNWDSLLVKHWTRDARGCKFESWQEWWEKFLLKLAFCADFLMSIPFRVTAVACKRPQSLCQKCRWQVTPKHTCTLDSVKSAWADYALHAGIVWEPIGETSPHATHQGTLGHSHLSSLSSCGLILSLKVELVRAS